MAPGSFNLIPWNDLSASSVTYPLTTLHRYLFLEVVTMISNLFKHSLGIDITSIQVNINLEWQCRSITYRHTLCMYTSGLFLWIQIYNAVFLTTTYSISHKIYKHVQATTSLYGKIPLDTRSGYRLVMGKLPIYFQILMLCVLSRWR